MTTHQIPLDTEDKRECMRRMQKRVSLLDNGAGFSVNGCASVELLNAYLSKEISFLQFTNRCSRALKDQAKIIPLPTCICFIREEDLDIERRKKGTKSEGLVSRKFYFVVPPLTTKDVPCLVWSRSVLGTESLSPRLIAYQDIVCAKMFTVSEPWIEVLCRLQQHPLLDLIRCMACANKERRIGIGDELQKRLSVFGEFRHAFYFQNPEHLVAWDLAEHWRHWETQKVSMTKRREEVGGRWGINMFESDFRIMSPSKFVSMLRNPPSRHERPSFADGVSIKVRQIFAERPIRKQYTGRTTEKDEPIYAEISPLPFSRGGDYWLPFCLRINGWLHGFPPKVSKETDVPKMTERTLSDELWWWNSRGEWFEQLRNEFPDNWERSAFLYELRARLLPEHTWDFFNQPWIQLDASQRGVLYYLWPPERQGQYQREGRIAHDTPLEYAFRNASALVDLAASDKELKKTVDAGSGAYYRYELYGIDGKPKRRSVPRKDWRWSLLEAFDLNHFGFTTLMNAEIKAKQRAVTLYESACAEAGLPPYQSIMQDT